MANSDNGNHETLLKFPCEFPIKAMGLANEEFEKTVLSIISQFAEIPREDAIHSRHSKNKKYCSLTVTILATGQEQLDKIYQALTAEKSVLVAL